MHKGCDRCYYPCEKPFILMIGSKKYKGHKDCLDRIQKELKSI